VLNAANEVAVAAFLGRRIGFLDIAAIVGDTLAKMVNTPATNLDEIVAVDAAARAVAGELVADRTH
jgi:1-deoxy-D-xylulose-5-phosphate reductoisomerase